MVAYLVVIHAALVSCFAVTLLAAICKRVLDYVSKWRSRFLSGASGVLMLGVSLWALDLLVKSVESAPVLAGSVFGIVAAGSIIILHPYFSKKP